MLNDLIKTYEKDKSYAPSSIHTLLDYFQQKYISCEITIHDYKNIYACLHKEGAKSAYDNTCFEETVL